MVKVSKTKRPYISHITWKRLQQIRLNNDLPDDNLTIAHLLTLAEEPGMHYLPTDLLPEPLGQDVIDAMGGLNCMGCFNNDIELSHANLTAWKKLEAVKTLVYGYHEDEQLIHPIKLLKILEAEG